MKEEKTANSAAPCDFWGENLDRDPLGLQPERPKYLNNLAWLDLDRSEGLEYWKLMELMGRYASANHDIIHQSVLNHLGGSVCPDPGEPSWLCMENAVWG